MQIELIKKTILSKCQEEHMTWMCMNRYEEKVVQDQLVTSLIIEMIHQPSSSFNSVSAACIYYVV